MGRGILVSVCVFFVFFFNDKKEKRGGNKHLFILFILTRKPLWFVRFCFTFLIFSEIHGVLRREELEGGAQAERELRRDT